MLTTTPIYVVQENGGAWRVTGPGINWLDERSGGIESEEKAKEMANLFSLLWHAGFKTGQREVRNDFCRLIGVAPCAVSDDPY